MTNDPTSLQGAQIQMVRIPTNYIVQYTRENIKRIPRDVFDERNFSDIKHLEM